MSHLLPARWLAALPAATVLSAIAQTPPTPPDTPALPYRSAFENYQRFEDDKPVAWQDANHRVRERGGWRAYAREGAGAAIPSGATAGRESGGGHDAHHGHGGHGHAAPAPRAKGQP